MVRCGQP